MHYGVSGVHMEICKRTGKLVLRRKLVEYWWHDRHAAARGSVSVLLRLGASEREGEHKKEECLMLNDGTCRIKRELRRCNTCTCKGICVTLSKCAVPHGCPRPSRIRAYLSSIVVSVYGSFAVASADARRITSRKFGILNQAVD